MLTHLVVTSVPVMMAIKKPTIPFNAKVINVTFCTIKYKIEYETCLIGKSMLFELKQIPYSKNFGNKKFGE